ncbi:MAG: uracil phosphoribosyltransferase [Bacteroidales bacterium]|nr:uracil phosphoribosyltransferase [Bacteroidales bacterium]
MQINIMNEHDTVLNHYLAEMRSVGIQSDPIRFRRNIERIGFLMAYEVSKTLAYTDNGIATPLGTAQVRMADEKIVVGSILRAGLPMHNGILDAFDHAENCFISAYRKSDKNGQLTIHVEYAASPSLTGKILLLGDPMLATGGSMELTYNALKRFGQPKHVHIMSIIGSREGVSYLQSKLAGEPVTLWIAAVDPKLNANKYIVPGLGDAGDLAFGTKL